MAIDVKAKCWLLSPALLQPWTAFLQCRAATYGSRLRDSVQEKVRPEDVRCYPATGGGDRKLQTMLWLYGLFASNGKGPIEAVYVRGAEARDGLGVGDMSEGFEFWRLWRLSVAVAVRLPVFHMVAPGRHNQLQTIYMSDSASEPRRSK